MLPECSEKNVNFTLEIEGFFNLLFAHIFNRFAIDSDEIKLHVDTLLKAIVSSKGKFTIKYRLYDSHSSWTTLQS